MLTPKTIQTDHLTAPQIMRKVIANTNHWLRNNDYVKNVNFMHKKGTYYFDNLILYGLTAKEVLEQATGLQFEARGQSAAKLIIQE